MNRLLHVFIEASKESPGMFFAPVIGAYRAIMRTYVEKSAPRRPTEDAKKHDAGPLGLG
mgnify:CR=1 FL=1